MDTIPATVMEAFDAEQGLRILETTAEIVSL